ncbi:MAG: polyphosphate polymerase domain-containing protein, partial [Planctomycetes bacterium]|nr:polyphosphate polymerase domain-containing protein [Planctomycetota bacterium]
IRQEIEPFLGLDHFSAQAQDHHYSVYSLYFDSPGLRLYQDTVEGARNRFKLRLRYYDAEAKGPIFAEVKKRNDQIVRKSRDLLQQDRVEILRQSKKDLFRTEFHKHLQELGARPSLRIRYRREAWECRGQTPVRITFDTRLQHAMPLAQDPFGSLSDWETTPLGGVILELKFTERRPPWLASLVQRFQLDKQSIPKYVMSVDAARASGGLRHHFAQTAIAPHWRHVSSL